MTNGTDVALIVIDVNLKLLEIQNICRISMQKTFTSETNLTVIRKHSVLSLLANIETCGVWDYRIEELG